jgi:ABC-type nitrate/sulfonate/bicarbonate transport system substrate-binding protein
MKGNGMSIEGLWYTRCPAATAASIAIRLGWLEKEFAPDGIPVSSLAAAQSKTAHLSHYSHSQPNSFRFGGYVPPLITRSRGTDVRVVGMNWADRAAGVYALPTSSIRSGADFKGKRLGVPRRLNDSIDWWRGTVLAGFHSALKMVGLTPDDVTFVDIDIAREFVADVTLSEKKGVSLWGAQSQFAVQREEVFALIRGEVDLLYSDAALAALLEASIGARKILAMESPEDAPTLALGYPAVLTVSGALLDERPDLVARWLARLLDADAWARANEGEAKRIIAQDAGLPEDFVDRAYSDRVHHQLDVSLAPNRVDLLKQRHDFLLAQGFLAAPIDFDRFVDPAPLAAAHALRAMNGPQ